MKKIILKYGLISGLFCSLLIAVATPLENKIGFDRGYFVGYTVIVLSFLLVFFGIRSYRENAGSGRISFGKAFAVGISITLITCAFYVLTWEIIYFNFMHDFMDKYGAYVIEKARAAGASPAALQAKIQGVQQMKQMYENPFFNVAMTFLEPFPVGLAITLLSAAILRKKPRPQLAQSPLPASS